MDLREIAGVVVTILTVCECSEVDLRPRRKIRSGLRSTCSADSSEDGLREASQEQT